MPKEVMTPEQVAEFLKLHPITILKMIKKGELKAMRIGRVYRIMEDDLNDFLEKSKI